MRRHGFAHSGGSPCRSPRTDGCVFADDHGKPLHPKFVPRAFRPHARRGGLPRTTFRVAHLIEAGVDPLTISRRLGHASVAFHPDRYGHLFDQAGATPRSGRRSAGGGARGMAPTSRCVTMAASRWHRRAALGSHAWTVRTYGGLVGFTPPDVGETPSWPRPCRAAVTADVHVNGWRAVNTGVERVARRCHLDQGRSVW